MRDTNIKRIFILTVLAFAGFSSYAQLPLLDLDAGKKVEIPKPSIDISISPDPIPRGSEGVIRATITIPDGFHQVLQEEYFTFGADPQAGIVFGEVTYPKGVVKDDVTSYYGKTLLERTIRVAQNAEQGTRSLSVSVVTQLCNEKGECYFPETTVQSVDFRITAPKTDIASLLWYLFLAFAGGVLLNLMPCVLPVLSIKALSIIKQSNEDRRRILGHGLSYAGGIVASLLVLAGITVALKLSGELVGWGFQFQNPLFVIALLAVIILFALSLFEVFVINPPPVFLKRKRTEAAGTGASGAPGYGGSFSGGILTVVLATPCTAPFLGVALGFAFTQEPLVIFLVFTATGIGLALPFLVLSVWPSFLSRIPKSGAWMNVFREAMAFLLVATAVWLVSVLGYQVGQERLTIVLAFLAVLAFAAWIYGRAQKASFGVTPRLAVKGAALALALVSSVFLVWNFNTGGEAIAAADAGAKRTGWIAFSEEELDARKATGNPVFLAFGAKWCLTCATNEAVTLESREVTELFREKGVSVLYGDFTNKDPLVSKWLTKLGRAGVPVYALYLPGIADPVIFPEIITADMIKDAFLNY